MGTITATNSTVNLGGAFTVAGLGTFQASGDTINLLGTVNNTGSTLALSGSTGSWNLAGGTINGGTVSESGGADVALSSSGGTLNGVTVNGPLDLTANNAYAYVTNGLTLDGTATLGYEARLYFSGGSQTLAGTGTVVFNNAIWQGLIADSDGMTLTIGAGITIDGGNSQGNEGSAIGYSYGWGGGSNTSVVNLGTINANVSGMSIVVIANGSGTFANEGTLSASNGGSLYVNGLTGNLGSVTLSGSGSSLTVSGSNYVVNQGLVITTGETVTLNGVTGNLGSVTLSGSGGSLIIWAATMSSTRDS